MGRLDLPDPVRDEDVWVSANELCKTRLCQTPGCIEDAAPGSILCGDCGRGEGQLGLRMLLNGPSLYEGPPTSTAGGRVSADSLSEKLLEVLRLTADGLTAQQVAQRLGKSESTVKTQHRKIRDLLDARTISEAVAIGFRKGLLH
jgi:DNA-binding CsgD family transcriptional regulator